MASPVKYTDEEKKEWVQLINDCDGIINKAYALIKEKGVNVSYPVFRKAYIDAGFKSSYSSSKEKVDRRFTLLEIKESIKLLEANKFNYPVTLKQLSELGINLKDRKSLKRWWIQYGKDVCDTNRFKNTVDGLSSRLAVRHEAMADKVYSVRNQIVERMSELIPKEKDLNKLSNAYKALCEVLEGGWKEQNALTFIQQYNSYYQNKENEQKNTDSGDIQDATPINE